MRIAYGGAQGDVFTKATSPSIMCGEEAMVPSGFLTFNKLMNDHLQTTVIRLSNAGQLWLKNYNRIWKKTGTYRRGWTFDAIIDISPNVRNLCGFEFICVDVGLRRRSNGQIKWKTANIKDRVPADVLRNTPRTNNGAMLTDEKHYATTIRSPAGGQMYLWEEPEDQSDDVEIERTNTKIAEAKERGYARGQQQGN